jgi:hypothetical protein
MTYEIIPNKKKIQKKFDYRVDKNMHHKLPDDIVKTLRDNSLKYTRKRKTIYDK